MGLPVDVIRLADSIHPVKLGWHINNWVSRILYLYVFFKKLFLFKKN
jgi:hypothetical protein